MFFGSALGSIFATHPPLEKRIKKIEPNWDSSFPETDQISEKVDLASEQTAGFAGGDTPSTGAHTEPSLTQAFDGPSQENIKHARSLLAKIPPHLLNLSREPFGARCVIFALLLDPSNPTIRDKQIALIRNRLETDTDKLTNKIYTNTSSLSCFEKFALVEEGASALHELSPRQLSDFSEVLNGLIAMDQQIDLFEWSMENNFNHLNFGKIKILMDLPNFPKPFRMSLLYWCPCPLRGRKRPGKRLFYKGIPITFTPESGFTSFCRRLRNCRFRKSSTKNSEAQCFRETEFPHRLYGHC